MATTKKSTTKEKLQYIQNVGFGEGLDSFSSNNSFNQTTQRPISTPINTNFASIAYQTEANKNKYARLFDGTNDLTDVATLQKFMNRLEHIGIQVKNRYYLTFSGLPDQSFLVTDISTPAVKMNVGEIKFDGRSVELPVNDEYTHDFTMTVWADVGGTAYHDFKQFILREFKGRERYDHYWGLYDQYLPATGYTIRLKQMADYSTFYGLWITYNDVRIKEISTLSFGESQNDLQQFDLTCTAISYDTYPVFSYESHQWS